MRRSSVEEEVSRRRGVKSQEGQDNESHEDPIPVWRAGLTTALTKACGGEGSGRWSGVEKGEGVRRRYEINERRVTSRLLRISTCELANEQRLSPWGIPQMINHFPKL